MRRAGMLVALCIAGTAQAGDGAFYFGGGATRTHYGLEGATDKRDDGFKLIAGVRFHPVLDFELDYSDHGRSTLPAGVACIALAGVVCPDTSHFDAKSTSFFGVAKAGGQLALIGKAGISLSRSRLRTPGQPGFGEDDTRLGLAWGVGLQATFRRLALRAEFEGMHATSIVRLEVASLDILYAF